MSALLFTKNKFDHEILRYEKAATATVPVPVPVSALAYKQWRTIKVFFLLRLSSLLIKLNAFPNAVAARFD